MNEFLSNSKEYLYVRVHMILKKRYDTDCSKWLCVAVCMCCAHKTHMYQMYVMPNEAEMSWLKITTYYKACVCFLKIAICLGRPRSVHSFREKKKRIKDFSHYGLDSSFVSIVNMEKSERYTAYIKHLSLCIIYRNA